MRIVQLANFYTARSGGLRTAIDHLGAGYVAAGHERVLFVPGRGWGERRDGADWRIQVPGRRVPGLDPYRVITDLTSVAARLDDLRPDVLEISDRLTLHRLSGWARTRGVGTVLIAHERLDAHLAVHLPRRVPLRRLADTANRRLAHRFDTIVSCSSFAMEEFTRIGVNHVVRVPLGVDLDTFRPSGETARREGPPTVVWSGRISKEKRPDLAVRTVTVLRERGVPVRLLMVGDGPMRAQLHAMVKDEPVDWTGFVADRAALSRLLASADVALNTCPAETFGFTVLEALACGTPVVAPNVGAAAELLTPGSGAATYVHPDAFASAITEVLNGPAAEQRRAARLRAEAFPWSRAVGAMLEIHTAVAATGAEVSPARR